MAAIGLTSRARKDRASNQTELGNHHSRKGTPLKERNRKKSGKKKKPRCYGDLFLSGWVNRHSLVIREIRMDIGIQTLKERATHEHFFLLVFLISRHESEKQAEGEIDLFIIKKEALPRK